MSGYIKYFENGKKNMLIMIENVLTKYDECWNKMNKALGIKFHSQPVYDEKNIKATMKEFNTFNTFNIWCG